MNKTLKKFAIAILAAGATVAATRAPAAEVTDTQVLENISVQLKLYSQGALNSTDKSLAATATTLTTSDLIQQLLIIGGFPTTTYKSDKLVVSTLYSNVLTGTPGTVASNVIASNILLTAGATNIYIVDFTGTNELPLFVGGALASYIITNYNVYYETATATNFADDVPTTTNVIFTDDSSTSPLPGSTTPLTTTPFTNVLIRDSAPNSTTYGLGYWVTIVPTTNATSTNITITQYTPTATNVFTNVSPQQICVMTPKTAGSFTLYDVSDWVSLNDDSINVYMESGKGLTETDFLGTNITGQTVYSIKDLSVRIIYGTNGTVTSQTNLVIDPQGFAKSTGKIQNLVTGGTAAEKLDFNIYANTSVPAASSSATFGGSFTANGTNVFVSSVTGVTNNTYTPGGSLYFANGTTFTTNTIGTNSITATRGIVDGSITVSYLSAQPEVVPVEP